MNILIKHAGVNDWRDLRLIRLKALELDPSVFGSNYQTEVCKTEADWKDWLLNPEAAIFLIYDKNVPVGMTGIIIDRNDPTKRQAILWGSWLEPSARGKGLSKLIYEERIQWARLHPTIERIVVSHRASNTASKLANQKHGFVYTHTEAKIWPDGSEEDNVFYCLGIKP